MLDHDEIPPLPPRCHWALVLTCITALAIGCWGSQCGAPTCAPPPAPPPDFSAPPTTWATDNADAGVIARGMPGGAFKGQKRPDPRTGTCGRDEVLILDACWMELSRKPGPDHCGPNGFEYEGACYVPVQQVQRPPTTLDQ